MRSFINAIVNVIRSGNRRNRVIVAPAANGVDALRASGPADMQYRVHMHALRPDHLGLERSERGLLLLEQFQRQQRSSLNASSAWRRLSIETGKREASQLFAVSCFTTCTATPATATAGVPVTGRPQAEGRLERRAALAARLPAST